MKVLFIGGTGNISTACSLLALQQGIDLYHFNRGKTPFNMKGITTLHGDIHKPEAKDLLQQHQWDVVVNWIAFHPQDVQRDMEIFKGRTKQYIFISSASCYQTPLESPVITEETPLSNPYWDYSRNKMACENLLMEAYHKEGFPVTIVRPSYTYYNTIPIAMGGYTEFTTCDRILKGLPIIVHGDGTSVWTNTHADDFAKGFTGLLGLEKAIGEAFHITSDEKLTWNNIYKQLAEALGTEAHMVHIPSDFICALEPSFTGSLLGDKTDSVLFDNSKIKAFVPGFEATIPFKEGIRRVLNWFDAHPEHKVVNPQTNAEIEHILKAYGKAGT